jgi:hypothetical protein
MKPKGKIKIERGDVLLILLSIGSFILHMVVFDNLEYHRDSLLYFTLGQHPDFGYASVPPLIGWIACLLQKLLGYSLFSVRILPAIFSGLMVWVVGLMTKEMGGGIYARVLAAIAFIIAPVSLRVFGLYQPVFLEYFFWTILFYLVIKYLNKKNNRILLLFGLASGLALLNKYLVALLLVSIVVSIIFSAQREILKSKYFYLSVLITIAVFLPNLIWQITHDFPVFQHIRELSQTQLNHVNRTDFLREQLLMPYAASLLTIPGLFYLLFSRRLKPYRLLGYSVLIVFLILLFLKGKSYYTMGVFPLLMVSGALLYENVFKSNYLRYLLPILVVLLCIQILPMGLPIYGQDGLVKYFDNLEKKYGLTVGRRFEDGSIHSLPQDYADMLGWTELTQLVNEAYESVEDKSKCIIFSSNYGQAGAVCVIGKKYGLPNAISFSDNFYYWAPSSFNPEPTSIIYINDELGKDIEDLFEDIKVIGKIENIHAREYGTTVFLCQKPNRSFNAFWSEVLNLLEN